MGMLGCGCRDKAMNYEDLIFLTEGEADCICALSHGLETVTVTGGAGTWKPEFTPHFQGRDVVICYDADVVGYNGAHKVAKELAQVAQRVRILIWPEEMLEPGAVEDPTPQKKRQRSFAAGSAARPDIADAYVPRLPANHGQDLTDYLVKHKRTVADLHALINNAELIEPEAPEEPEDTELDYPTRFFHFGKSGRPSFKPALLAREILEQNQLITDPESGLTYRWNGQYWKGFGIREIRKIALGKLGIEASRSRAEDAAAQVADLSVLPGGTQLNPDPDILCLQNGQFNLRTGDVTRFNPDLLCTYQLGVSFDPNQPQPCPIWDRHLAYTVQIPEVIKEKQEFFGYCLTRSTRYEKALLLLGPGADGKSTSLNVLQALVGEENCSNVNLNSLDDQFHRVSLHNRVLNVFTEAQAKAFESDIFKAVVSGDRINAAYKHKDVFEFRPFCKLAFSSNHLPEVLDNSDGFFRKVLLIKHRRQFFGPDRDPYLLDKLLTELPGIFGWAWVGLIRLRERGEFKLCEASQQVLNEYREENNPVMSFIRECTFTETESGQAPEVAKQDLYEEYAKFCKKRGFYPMNAIHFARELRQQIPEVEVVRRYEYVGQSKVRVRKYKGVGIAV